ncbi:MAG: VOC family protein [Patulibacter minatonensis]
MPSIARITLGTPELDVAGAFYARVLGAPVPTEGAAIDLHGRGELASATVVDLAERADTPPEISGFRGFAISYLVAEPGEVDALVARTVAEGGEEMKPARQGFFGGYAAVVRTVDGSLWKIASERKKDWGKVGEPPVPIEVGALLGVASPKASKAFFTALGLATDRGRGSRHADVGTTPGAVRLGLLPREGLAKDLGNEPWGSGFAALELTLAAASLEELDAILTGVREHGGRVTAAPSTAHDGTTAAHFTDPDGYLWKIETR